MTKRVKLGAKVGIILTGKSNGGQGTYSEYVTVSATEGFFPLPDDVPVEDAASFWINPYTALGILDTAKSCGSKALVHTAGASQLGQMMNKLVRGPESDGGVGGGYAGMQIINVVRREEQVQLLEALGAPHIVSTHQDNWKETLQSKIKELNCTVAFDAVAGDMTGDLLSLMPPKGTVYVYGGLAGKVGNIDPMDLIYKEKQVKGFIVKQWVEKGGILMTVPRMMSAAHKVNPGLRQGGWSSSQFQDTTFATVQEDLAKALEKGVTGLKLRVRIGQVE